MNLTPVALTLDLLERFYIALQNALWEATHAENFSVGPVERWPISTRLNCHSCDVRIVATCPIGQRDRFMQLLKSQTFKCRCGGILTDGPALIKIASVGGLDKCDLI